MPLLDGARRERRVQDASQGPPTELEETGGVFERTRREQEVILRKVAFEESEDNQGTSPGQVDMARGEVRAPRCG